MDIPSPPPLYEIDFAAWCAREADRLRSAGIAGNNAPLDWNNLAEEIESLGRSELHAIHSALMRVVEHLLKLACSPAADPRRGWIDSVLHSRDEAVRRLAMSPGLRARLDLQDIWQSGRRLAVRGLTRHGEPTGSIPADCPWTLDQLLDEDWWPEG